MRRAAQQALRLAFSPACGSQSGTQQLAAAQLRAVGGLAEVRCKAGPVPEGHANSDLSPTACHIGLGRRRDLSLRQDLRLWQNDKCLTLSDVLKGQRVILVGFPGGKVCVEKHIPGYVQAVDALSTRGVDKIVCVTPDEPAKVHQLAQSDALKSSKVEIYADKNGGVVRMLGLEIGSGEGAGPKCQRYAAVVEDGVLLKLKVESEPAQLAVTDAVSMLRLWECIYPAAAAPAAGVAAPA